MLPSEDTFQVYKVKDEETLSDNNKQELEDIMAKAYEGNADDLRIVLLGVSGAGKSPTGNAILGRDVFKESRTRESEIQRGRVEDRNISIIDTPGFFNTHLTDEEMKKQMMKSLYLSDPGPHVFLLVVNLEKFKEDKRNIVEKIQENFGEESLLFTMVLFIGQEKISKRKRIEIIESEETQKILNNFEGRFQVINNKNECDTYQISKLLKSIDEMVKNNGGQNYSNEIYLKNQLKLREQKERIIQEENRLKKEEKRAKQEQEWKRQIKREKIQEARGAWKQKRGIGQEEKIKSKNKEESINNESRKENVKERAQYLKEKEDAVQEDLRKQMQSRREKERQRWELEREKTQEDPSRPEDLRIMVLGKTGAGKTETANSILGRKAFIVRSLYDMLKCEKQEVLVSGRTISIIDTPRLLDAPWYNIFQDELKCDIEECLEMSAPGPHVFLLVVELNGRYTEKEKYTVKWIQENFGEEAVHHTFILFTHVDLLMNESLDQYIRKSPDLQSLIDSCGRRFHSLNNQDRHNQNQVTELLEKIDQLIKNNGGKHYANEKSMEAQNTLREQKEKQNVSLSPQDNPEQEIGINQQEESKDETKEGDNEMHQEEEINTQSKMNEGESERNQEPTETQLHGLFRETDKLSEMALRLSLERAMAHSNMSRQDLRIVLLGLLGSGKSSTGNTILNRDAFRAGLMTTTRSCEKQEAVVYGRTISIIDTPAIILNGSLLMAHQRCEIEKSLEMSVPGPHVFLLMINLLEFTEEVKNTVKWIQENFEKVALNHTIALFTHDDLLIDESLNEYLKKSNDLKSLIDSCGGRYHSFNNKAIQNCFQVIKLLVKIDEMMERNGGNHYTKHNIFKSAQNKNQSNTNQDDGCVIL